MGLRLDGHVGQGHVKCSQTSRLYILLGRWFYETTIYDHLGQILLVSDHIYRDVGLTGRNLVAGLPLPPIQFKFLIATAF